MANIKFTKKGFRGVIKKLKSLINTKLDKDKVVTLTQDEYDALETKDTDTLYFIKDE